MGARQCRPDNTGLVHLVHRDLDDRKMCKRIIPELLVGQSEGKLVRVIELESNELSTLPESIAGLSESLTSLQLQYNQIRSLPMALGCLTNLQTLSLYENSIKSVPEALRSITSLTSLDMRYNELSELPDWIGELKSLTSLAVSRNSIHELPTSIGDLVELQELKISSNRIKSLPDSLSRLFRLIDLRITDNRLLELPECLKPLPLSSLHLEKNQITTIPSWLLEMPTLTVLELSNNALDVPYEICQGGLQELRLFFRQSCKNEHGAFKLKADLVNNIGSPDKLDLTPVAPDLKTSKDECTVEPKWWDRREAQLCAQLVEAQKHIEHLNNQLECATKQNVVVASC